MKLLWKGAVLAGMLAVVGQVWAVNVNSADVAALADGLVGVGEKTAQAIVDEREAHGKFKDSNDLKTRVKGVGDRTIEKNQGNIEFD